jgi:hypothetical protein
MWASLLASSPVLAQSDIDGKIAKDLTEDKVLGDKAAKEDGWQLRLMVGATGSYNHSRKVVGSVDGAMIQLGLLLDGGADLVHGQHIWENALAIKQTQTRTPQIEPFIKSADELTLKTTYIYHLPSIDWLGPFVRGSLSTQLLRGYDVRAGPVTLIRNLRNGTQISKAVPSQIRFALTKPFEPLLLKESAGCVAKPWADKSLTLKAKVGAGLQHVIVGKGFALAEDRNEEIEYNQLVDSTEAGGLIDLDANGALADNITWTANAGCFYPFAGSELSGSKASSVELGAKLSVKLATYLSFDYVFSAKWLPQILQEWQIQNGVTMTLSYDVI